MAHLIKIDKTMYALGFNWYTYTSKKQLPTKETDTFDVLTWNKEQFGYALTEKNEKFLSAKSLANLIKINTSYIGVFTLIDIENKEFFWIFATHNGKILGSGDTICKTQEEIEETIKTITDFSPIPINPIYFKTVDESITFIKANITSSKFSNTIKPLYKSKQKAKQNRNIMLIALVLICASYGVIKYLDIKNIQELKEAALFSKQTTENKIKNIYANTHKYFPMEWKQNYFPLDIYSVCKPALFSLPINVNGWALEKAICTPKEVNSYWKHQNQASFVDLPFNGELTKPKEVFSRHEIANIKNTQNSIEHTALLTQEEVSKLLYQITQNMGSSLSLSFSKSAVKEFEELKISITAPFKKGKFEWKSVPSNLILNSSLFEALNAIPSLVIKQIEYNNGQWSIKGDLYVKA